MMRGRLTPQRSMLAIVNPGNGAQGPSVTADQGGCQPRSSRPKKGRPLPSTEDDPGNPSVDFGGERRSNEATHSEVRLLCKGRGRELGWRFWGTP